VHVRRVRSYPAAGRRQVQDGRLLPQVLHDEPRQRQQGAWRNGSRCYDVLRETRLLRIRCAGEICQYNVFYIWPWYDLKVSSSAYLLKQSASMTVVCYWILLCFKTTEFRCSMWCSLWAHETRYSARNVLYVFWPVTSAYGLNIHAFRHLMAWSRIINNYMGLDNAEFLTTNKLYRDINEDKHLASNNVTLQQFIGFM